MVLYKEGLGIIMEVANLPDASVGSSALKSYTCEDGEVAAAVPGETEMF